MKPMPASKTTRKQVSKGTKEAVLSEFNHRCAICGADRPQIHHIDENPSNNEPQNLLPLCPNCHLTDQHNPTSPVDHRKLALFRKFKDPTILWPQFEPFFRRVVFLLELSETDFDSTDMESRVDELVRFIGELQMGAFYAEQIRKLIEPPSIVRGTLTGGFNNNANEHLDLEHRRDCVEKYQKDRDPTWELVVELLRYQTWEQPASLRSGLNRFLSALLPPHR